jgi:biotin carboxyl carrier protein
MVYEIIVGNKDGGKDGSKSGPQTHRLELERSGEGWACRFDGQEVHIDAVIPRRDVLSLLVDGHAYEIKREQTATDLHMWVGSSRFAVELRDPRSLQSRQKTAGDEKGPKKILAPMPGRVVRLLVEENSDIEAGQGILVVEAMKMQNEIKSPKKGIVKKISTTPGAAVNPGDILAIVE